MTATAVQIRPNSRLQKTLSGRLALVMRYVFYGDNGIGKSTLASHSPKPIWFDIEDGSGRLDVDRYSFHDGVNGHVPSSYADVLSAIDDLIQSDHGYQTLVIDTLDRLEALLWQDICRRNKKESIEDFGYGRGYTAALDEWRRLCLSLDRLRTAKRMSVVILAHSHIRTFKSPTTDDYDRYQLRVNDKAAGFLKEWADVVGFCAFEEGGAKLDKDDDRAKGYSTGKRFVHFERTAAYDAKTRIVLPSKIELDPRNPWEPLAKAVDDGVNLSADELRALMDAELARIADPELTAKVLASAKKIGDDVEALSRFVNSLKKQPTKPVTT